MGCFSCPLASFWVASTQIADERPFEGEPWIASRARILLLPGAAGAGLRLPAKGRSSTICVEVTQKQSKARPRKVLLPGSAGASARRGQPSSARGGRGGRAPASSSRRRPAPPSSAAPARACTRERGESAGPAGGGVGLAGGGEMLGCQPSRRGVWTGGGGDETREGGDAGGKPGGEASD